MTRAARALINLSSLRHNLSVAKKHTPEARQLAIIKANGYGHGIEEVAQALSAADAFGVACLEEALCLREAGIKQPIVLLEGVMYADDLPLVREHHLQLVVHQIEQVEMLENSPGVPIPVWLKVDTGMHRLGILPGEAPAIYQRLVEASAVASPVRLMTHLANADDRRDDTTMRQIYLFTPIASSLHTETSIANSAGILGWPASHSEWVRPGIMLYGVSPFLGSTAANHDLKPVMTLQSEVIAINKHQRGDHIGYGGTWRCPETMPVGVVAIGYGDGYPRHALSGTPILVNGKRTQVIGRVSMDMLCVDLRGCPGTHIGDPVVLWGEGLPVEEVAEKAATIAYELLCKITSRVNFEYLD